MTLQKKSSVNFQPINKTSAVAASSCSSGGHHPQQEQQEGMNLEKAISMHHHERHSRLQQRHDQLAPIISSFAQKCFMPRQDETEEEGDQAVSRHSCQVAPTASQHTQHQHQSEEKECETPPPQIEGGLFPPDLDIVLLEDDNEGAIHHRPKL